MIKTERKKADLTANQIVIIVVLIVSFVILLIVLAMLNFKTVADKETCRNSIASRGKASFLRSLFPIKCATEYVCINRGGKCSYSGNIRNIEIGKTTKELELSFDNLVSECYTMTGEKKIKYDSTGSCIICYVIYLGKDLGSLYNITNFLSNKMPNKEITYKEHINPLDLNEDITMENTKQYAIISFIKDESEIGIVEFKEEKLRKIGCTNILSTA